MSIIKREKSSTGIYHVLAQGAGNHELFLDDEDYQVFVEYLARLMKEAWAEDDDPDRPYFHTYAYCLTPKQFRLIVKEEKYQVSAIMQSISQLYSRYFSSKYGSYGPLYRRRYYSEPINDEAQLETAMRYVHQEPRRQGLNLEEQRIERITRKGETQQISQKGETQRILRISRKEDIQEISQGPQIVRISRKGGMTEILDEYPWSSWHEYVGQGSDLPSVCEKPDACHNMTTEEWRELLSKPLPDVNKYL